MFAEWLLTLIVYGLAGMGLLAVGVLALGAFLLSVITAPDDASKGTKRGA